MVELGVTALEIMPVADWAGKRGWGYDGVLLFAPYHAYGTPDDFRTLVDACHQRGLAVILDVGLQPPRAGGKLQPPVFRLFLSTRDRTIPGARISTCTARIQRRCEPCCFKTFATGSIEFRIDGFRMDATHTIHDPSDCPFAQLRRRTSSTSGAASSIAEDDRNARSVLDPRDKNGWHFDGLWSDDFHHVMRVSQTGDRRYFYCMFQGLSRRGCGSTLQNGWFYTGQVKPFSSDRSAASLANDFPPQCFVYCISNHDQVGNRLLGDRFHQVISPAAYRAVALFHLLVPETPLIFMGQEWGGQHAIFLFYRYAEGNW